MKPPKTKKTDKQRIGVDVDRKLWARVKASKPPGMAIYALMERILRDAMDRVDAEGKAT